MNFIDKHSPLKRFFNLLKVEKQEIFSIYVYALFNGILTLSLPLGIQAIINLITAGQVSTSWIVLVIFVIVGIGLSGVMQIMQLTISENLQQKIFTKSAFEFAYRIPKMKIEAITNDYMPEMVNRFFDTLSIQKGLSKILMDFSSATLQVFFGLILLSLYHPFFIFFSIILVTFVYLIFKFTAPQGLKSSLKESKYKYELVHWLEELARTKETFKLAGNSELPMKKTNYFVEGYLTSRKSHFKTLLVQYINLVAFKVIIAAGLLIIGGLLVINQKMNIGQFVASEIIIILILASVEKIILCMETIYDVLTALEKIGTVTDIPLDRDTGTKFPIKNGDGISIAMNNLTYRFKDKTEDFISNINLNIQSGEKVCISGYDGSGKTLLLNIIAGLYENFSGTITYNGIPLGNWCKEELHSHIGDNISKEKIFKGTLEENISLGKQDVDYDQLIKVSKIVGLDKFVESLPDGYNTQLLSEGQNLPTSIRLKIILARCITGTPKLILMEDHFNQLNESDKKRFINYLTEGNWTVIAVSNDISIAEKFNKTIILEKGKKIAEDKFDALRNNSNYSKLFQTK